ncbi:MULTISPECIES: ring-cleaving dioxygenase [unclassified Bosea (in: a-proteobacteria)]|uniref:ring-cleaving dioxygenase n=1 Tax=unclassified Bosea (in: a-proteobacteria) TaxID=2653178 RepID=UPI000F761A89|nr:MULTISPECIES: ring-cleaving dioxygenase [unclassified Bosea (in: a-proteobacteria)]AZO77913.1 ring-cleaving dioxygenase [Bosea sp. Tri-49]RXT19332.1 ring-cleaving dioxygenase [Bosea sp. Tri-39]RXT41604.1 ring-cleaving dioxygenase [Bosea sp. Tri-54]
MQINGIHHVTAIAGPARRNLDFYSRVLGLRLVKKTVNFDDPTTWHLYFGDADGNPGTILTFFPWEHVAPGRLGVGETEATSFRIPEAAIGYWAHRFVASGVAHDAPRKRFGETMLAFRDPDGTRLALVAVPGSESEPAWDNGEVPAEVAIRGFHGVTLLLDKTETTAAILRDVFGFVEAGREDSTVRMRAVGAAHGGIVDLRAAGGFLPARMGAGSVHHIAFRAGDDAEQERMVKQLAETFGLRTTGQRDRDYFRSVYFREPGGVLFEIATDAPGFTIDEPADGLGGTLKLPAQYEKRRAEIEAVLPALA